MTDGSLGVVMPVYNEAAALERVLGDVTRYVLDTVEHSELIVVDDHSTDESGAILASAAQRDARIRVVTNDHNRGHGPSVYRGMQATNAQWILHIDSDGQLDLSEFPRLQELSDRNDLVLGVRAARNDPLHRRIVSGAARALASLFARHRVSDANTPFKLIRRSLFDHLAPSIPSDTFAPTVAMVVLAHRAHARVAEVDVTHLPRPHGRSTLRPVRLAAAAVRSAAESARAATRPVPAYTPDAPPANEYGDRS